MRSFRLQSTPNSLWEKNKNKVALQSFHLWGLGKAQPPSNGDPLWLHLTSCWMSLLIQCFASVLVQNQDALWKIARFSLWFDYVCVCVFAGLVVIQCCPSSQRSKDKDRTLIRAEESNTISVSGPRRSTPDPDTNRSVNLSFPADSQVVVAVQSFDGHHSHVHRSDLQNT